MLVVGRAYLVMFRNIVALHGSRAPDGSPWEAQVDVGVIN
jgi:hypothetical protein